MVAALEIYFDPVAERRLRTLWTALEEAGVTNLGTHTHRRHRPHISLVGADELNPLRVTDAVAGLTLPPPVSLSFQHVGAVPRRRAVARPGPDRRRCWTCTPGSSAARPRPGSRSRTSTGPAPGCRTAPCR